MLPLFRFKPLKANFLSALSQPSNNGTYSGSSSPQETEKLCDNQKLLPMSTKASSNDDSGGSTIIEYGKRFLPPLWVDI